MKPDEKNGASSGNEAVPVVLIAVLAVSALAAAGLVLAQRKKSRRYIT